jgi:transposase
LVDRLAAERAVRIVRTAVWKFLDRRDLTHKKRQHTRASRTAPM